MRFVMSESCVWHDQALCAVTAEEIQEEGATNGRKHMRYPLRASIVYRWTDGAGVERRGRGWTENVSEEGVLVSTDICPEVGALINLRLRVRSLRVPKTTASLRMEMNARVVRVVNEAQEGKELGFAARKRNFASVPEDGSSPLAWRSGGLEGLRTN